MSQRLFQPTDTRRFRAQVAQLRRAGFRIIRTSDSEILVAGYSYFPDTGIILKNGLRERVRGLDAFIRLLGDKRRPSGSEPSKSKASEPEWRLVEVSSPTPQETERDEFILVDPFATTTC